MMSVILKAGLVEIVGTAINISGGGMYVMVPASVPEGTPVELVIDQQLID